MSLRFHARTLLLCTLPLLFATAAQAQLQLANADSSLSFVTVKADNVAEVHTFDRLSGNIGADGSLAVSIDLSSVNTLIPIRNERMQNLLFETGMYPEARITGTVDMGALSALEIGASTSVTLEFSLNLHAQTNPLTAELLVTRLADGYLAATRKPVIVNAEPFGLAPGVEALREIAGLSRISLAVPVSFAVVFRQP